MEQEDEKEPKTPLGCGTCHACRGIRCMLYHPGHDCRAWLYDYYQMNADG